MKRSTATRWLKISTVASAAYALWMATAAIVPAALPPLQWNVDLMFFGQPTDLTPPTLLFATVVASIIFGWVVMLHLLARQPDVPPAVWRAAVYGLVAWFIFDCVGSILTGGGMNIPANIVFLVGLVPPAWALGREHDAQAIPAHIQAAAK